MIGIYKIINNINKKIYIGQSTRLEKRWDEHKRMANKVTLPKSNIHLYSSMKKHGIENFNFIIIEESSVNLLDEREKYWINYYSSNNPDFGYNLTTGGHNGNINAKLTLEEVQEIRHLLKTTTLSQKEIGDRFNISRGTISNISTGVSYVDENETYPLRPKNKNYGNCLKKERICSICHENELSRNTKSGICLECTNYNKQQSMRPNREKLKNAVKNNTITNVAKQYEVDRSTIMRWLKMYKLPNTKHIINSYSKEEWNNL